MSENTKLKLMTWMATNRDPRFLENVIYALEHQTGKKVDTVYYLCGGPADDQPKIKDILETVKSYFKNQVKVEPIDVGAFNSSDHDEVMKSLMKALAPRLSSMGDICVNISSGTPTMSTIWMVLKAMDFFRGRATYYNAPKYKPSIHKSNDVVPKEKQIIETINFDAAVAFIKEIQRSNKKVLKGSLEDSFLGLNSRSPLRQEAYEKILKYAQFDNVPMLILGERGVGKSSSVRQLIGKIKNKKVLEAMCGALDSNLADSMLFGHKKGAFTGAISDQPGIIEQAEGQVLFLDEVQDLPRSTQRKLLRTIQEKDHPYTPLGGKTEMKANVQLIFATNNSMEQIYEKLDPDFLDRISIYTVRIPSLSECAIDLQDDWQTIWTSCRPKADKKDGKVIPEIAPWNEPLQEFFDYEICDGGKPCKVNLEGNIRSLQKVAYRLLAWSAWDEPQKMKSVLEDIQNENIHNHNSMCMVNQKKNMNIAGVLPPLGTSGSPLAAAGASSNSSQGTAAGPQVFDIENFPEFQNCTKKQAEHLFKKRLAQWAHKKYGTFEKAAEALDCTRETLVKC